MPPDPTTIPGVPETPPASIPPVAGPDALATSRELRNVGVDLNTVDWQARYNGAVGAFNQKLGALTETNERLAQENGLLKKQIDALTGQLEGVKADAGKLPDIQKQLDEATKANEAAKGLIDKQKLLFEFPNLLGGATGPNPFVDLVMSSTLLPDQLREQLAAVSTVVAKPAGTPLAQGATPPPPPAAAAPGSDDAESYHKQAMDWHTKFLDSHGTDMQAASEEAKFWTLYKKAQQPS